MITKVLRQITSATKTPTTSIQSPSRRCCRLITAAAAAASSKATVCTMTLKTVSINNTRATNCLLLLLFLLFCAIANAVPNHSRVVDHELDTATTTNKNSPKVNPSSLQSDTGQILNDDLHHRSPSATATATANQSAAAAKAAASATIATDDAQPTTRIAPSASEPSIAELALDDETDAADNTTLLIDYNQQSYLSTSEAPLAIVSSSSASSSSSEPAAGELPDVTTTIPVDLLTNAESEISKRQVEPIDATESSSSERLAEMRAKPDATRDLRNARINDKVKLNTSEIFATLLKKKPYSKYWSVEQKWDDIFKRFMAVQGTVKTMMMKNFLRDIEYYADVSLSQKCADDLRFIQNYTAKSTNMRWMAHMFDSTGKSESGMLTGNLAQLGHVIQCIKVRAPARPTNDSFDERYFEKQTATLGERFRGKYCLASLRPVMPEKPHLVSRFEDQLLNRSLLSNISYMGEPVSVLKQRALETTVPYSVYESIDRLHNRLDQVPFESELYEYLIGTRNFMYSLPRFMGVCYPSSCSKDDIRYSIQKSVDDQHQVVDIEFECEVEESDAWEWFTTPRLVICLLLTLVATISFGASVTRHILVDRLQLKRRLNNSTSGAKNSGKLANLIASLDLLSMDKCAGILFIKTKPATTIVDKDKVENNRSTSIDALKGFMMLMLIYSELVHLGCLPVPFMWSKWSDAMFPFFRSYVTQIFLNTSIWTEAFYMISAYLICLKLLENDQSISSDDSSSSGNGKKRLPAFSNFVMKRYIRLVLPMVAFMMFSYVWPRLSNGFVMQDQASKILAPCDSHGWINMLMFHNHYAINQTCLWPSHVSASFFQLHLLSYPILILLLLSLRSEATPGKTSSSMARKLLAGCGLGTALLLASVGLVYSALRASGEQLIVPFLIDYIDFDNYQRVIEWTVLPTHNHITSYMIGILLAYFVVRSKAQQASRAGLNGGGQWSQSGETYIQREGSLESVVSSSTQELNLKPAFMFGGNKQGADSNKLNQLASTPSTASSEATFSSVADEQDDKFILRKWIYQICSEVALILVMLASLTTSYYWNAQGHPMNANQTFWYMIGTKLCFNLAFACLFYRHFATRRNSSNPWMITRFLVPIGRMSLMLFYVSWPVIWFDLLASLYQWHPSHYFIFEKYNEIIFMALIISMFAYGAFEGTVKIIQYQAKSARLNNRRQSASKKEAASSSSSSKQRLAVGFENLFQPTDWAEEDPHSARQALIASSQMAAGKSTDNQMFNKGSSVATLDSSAAGEHNNRRQVTGLSVAAQAGHCHYQKTKGSSTAGGVAAATTTTTSAAANRKRLSIADQYKLNAELRANYSFASIGLYESAGATDDLPQPSPLPSPSPANNRQRSTGAGGDDGSSDTYGSPSHSKP